MLTARGTALTAQSAQSKGDETMQRAHRFRQAGLDEFAQRSRLPSKEHYGAMNAFTPGAIPRHECVDVQCRCPRASERNAMLALASGHLASALALR